MRRESPALYQRFLVQRNQAWARKISAILQQPGVTFIAVGSAQLAAPDSLQSQPRKLGFSVQRL